MGFPLRVVTPERVLFETDAQALVLRSSSGDMTVLDGHTSLVAGVVPGVVRIDRAEGEPVRLAVHGGFLQVDTVPGGGEGPAGLSTRVALIAGVAELVTEIDVERARRAREAAETELAELRSTRTDEGEQAGAAEEAALAATRRAELRLEAVGAIEAIR
jgi:F-type H+-transporting ATPase subunit epsilon